MLIPRKKQGRNKIVEIGKGLAPVRIYTVNCSSGYPHCTVAWKEGGRRRSFASS